MFPTMFGVGRYGVRYGVGRVGVDGRMTEIGENKYKGSK